MTTRSYCCSRQGGESPRNKIRHYLTPDQVAPALAQVLAKWDRILKPRFYVLRDLSLKFFIINF
jgi:hypothetical protein